MRIGCSTISFAPQTVEEALQRIADLGFDVIDLAAAPGYFEHVRLIDPPSHQTQRLVALTKGHGLEVAGVQSVPWLLDALDDPAELRRRYTVAADVAEAVGARAWIVDASRTAEDPSARPRYLDRFKRTITMAAELAAERGLRLGIEAPHTGTLAQTLPETLEVLEAADLPELGIDLDTSHVYNCGSSTAEVIDAIGHRIIHVALRDAHRDGTFCTPGDGDFDFAEFFQLLARAGYTGDATLELEPVHEDATADDRAHEAARARDHLGAVLESIAPGRASSVPAAPATTERINS